MNKTISKVHLYTENCELIVVDAKDIIFMHLNPTTRSIQGSRGSFESVHSTDVVFVAIHKDAKADAGSVLFDENEGINRITDDITSVGFEYDDGSTESIRVEWPDKGHSYEMSSDYQTSFRTTEGHLVWISEEGSVLDELANNVDTLARNM